MVIDPGAASKSLPIIPGHLQRSNKRLFEATDREPAKSAGVEQVNLAKAAQRFFACVGRVELGE